ncbi:MAG: hypothetical protein HY042_11755, partial [Spirochaetia bacterium]|nr:hypothetical protein [Spirochaetia bacterium]
ESPVLERPLDAAVDAVPAEGERRDVEGSIAKNIVLETRERRLNSASILSVPLLGSRDWNRSPHYAFEVPVKYYDECVENFNKAYHVNLKEDILAAPLPSAAALVRSGAGQAQFGEYVEAIRGTLEELADEVLRVDFPGTEKPLVFLYHCGPNAFYNMLLYVLRQRKQGEIFYVDSTNNTVREYPDELIRKCLIDWWTGRFAALSGEDVDSYLTYSRSIEMVKKDYRLLQEHGMQQLKREQPHTRYAEREKWIKENHARVFGIRKLEIFKRFLTGTVF